MADTKQVTLKEDAKVVERQRKDGTGTFEVVTLTGTDGTNYSGFLKAFPDGIPTKGEVVELNIQPVKTAKGTLNNVLSATVIGGGQAPFDTDEKPKTTTKTTHTKTKSSESKSESPSSVVPSKDISMEVSGLLQALISAGRFDDKDVPSIERDLRTLINIKRKVAQDLEKNGSA